MAKKALPSPEVLRQLLRYEPETGKLFWRERPRNRRWNTRWAGAEAFTAMNRDGYRIGSVNGCTLLAHRVIWAMQFGEWPPGKIDHSDTIRSNNSLDNLRQATDSENAQNRNIRSDNRCGAKGVTALKSGRYQARIMLAGKSTSLGTFGCMTAAAIAYAKGSLMLHGAYSRKGDLVIRQRDAACP